MTKQCKTSGQLKNAAKDSLTGKYGNAILIVFLSELLTSSAMVLFMIFFLSMSPSGYSTGSLQQIISQTTFFLLSLAVTAVLGVLNFGVQLFFLKIACGQPASVDDLFYGMRNQFQKALIISAVLMLVQRLCLNPYQLFMRLYLNTMEPKWLIVMLICAVIGLFIYVPLSLGISQSFYLLLDFPDKKPGELLKLSLRIMKGHKKRLFYIQASFLPLMFLCLLSLGIGFLWLYPYMHMTFTHFYVDLMNPAKMD